MSKSIRKHTILKFGCGPRKSWKKWRTFANKYNRRVAKGILRSGGEYFPKEKKLCAWDWDFHKWYFTKEYAKRDYRLIKK